MDEDQLYVTTPPHKPPCRVPADTIAVEWLTEQLEQLPNRKEMYRAVLLCVTTGARLAWVFR
jgi:hypothetical protein